MSIYDVLMNEDKCYDSFGITTDGCCHYYDVKAALVDGYVIKTGRRSGWDYGPGMEYQYGIGNQCDEEYKFLM